MKPDAKELPKEPMDLSEKGTEKDGVRQRLDRRLFVQLLVFGNCPDNAPLISELEKSGIIDAVLYNDINDPQGVGLLTMHEDPAFFTGALREVLNSSVFASLKFKEEYTMLGRTYALGHERDLEDWLLKRPARVARNPEWPWAIWYPIRRSGEYALTTGKEQCEIMREHGAIGRAFGEADFGHDIRLASYGLDKFDNDFVVGLVGSELHPLSALVQSMRKTKQTSTYIEKMGPFFIGRAVWQGT